MGSAPGPGGGTRRAGRGRRRSATPTGWSRRTATACAGDRPVVFDCANGAAAAAAPRSPRASASTPAFIGAEPDGRNINDGVGSTHLERASRAAVRGRRGRRAASRSTATPTAAWRSTRAAGPVNGDAIIAALAIDRRRRRRARRRPGRRHVDDEPGLPPADARARDRRRGDRRRRPLRARADARDRRDARRRAVGPCGRPRAPHDRRRARDGAHAARRARPARHVDGRASPTSCSPSRRSSSPSPADRAALDGRRRGSGRRSSRRGEAWGGRPRGGPRVGHRAGRAGHGRGGRCDRVRAAVRPSCRTSLPPKIGGTA